MAITRFDPIPKQQIIEQPALNTYVPLPMDEIKDAYGKRHDMLMTSMGDIQDGAAAVKTTVSRFVDDNARLNLLKSYRDTVRGVIEKHTKGGGVDLSHQGLVQELMQTNADWSNNPQLQAMKKTYARQQEWRAKQKELGGKAVILDSRLINQGIEVDADGNVISNYDQWEMPQERFDFRAETEKIFDNAKLDEKTTAQLKHHAAGTETFKQGVKQNWGNVTRLLRGMAPASEVWYYDQDGNLVSEKDPSNYEGGNPVYDILGVYHQSAAGQQQFKINLQGYMQNHVDPDFEYWQYEEDKKRLNSQQFAEKYGKAEAHAADVMMDELYRAANEVLQIQEEQTVDWKDKPKGSPGAGSPKIDLTEFYVNQFLVRNSKAADKDIASVFLGQETTKLPGTADVEVAAVDPRKTHTANNAAAIGAMDLTNKSKVDIKGHIEDFNAYQRLNVIEAAGAQSSSAAALYANGAPIGGPLDITGLGRVVQGLDAMSQYSQQIMGNMFEGSKDGLKGSFNKWMEMYGQGDPQMQQMAAAMYVQGLGNVNPSDPTVKAELSQALSRIPGYENMDLDQLAAAGDGYGNVVMYSLQAKIKGSIIQQGGLTTGAKGFFEATKAKKEEVDYTSANLIVTGIDPNTNEKVYWVNGTAIKESEGGAQKALADAKIKATKVKEKGMAARKALEAEFGKEGVAHLDVLSDKDNKIQEVVFNSAPSSAVFFKFGELPGSGKVTNEVVFNPNTGAYELNQRAYGQQMVDISSVPGITIKQGSWGGDSDTGYQLSSTQYIQIDPNAKLSEENQKVLKGMIAGLNASKANTKLAQRSTIRIVESSKTGSSTKVDDEGTKGDGSISKADTKFYIVKDSYLEQGLVRFNPAKGYEIVTDEQYSATDRFHTSGTVGIGTGQKNLQNQGVWHGTVERTLQPRALYLDFATSLHNHVMSKDESGASTVAEKMITAYTVLEGKGPKITKEQLTAKINAKVKQYKPKLAEDPSMFEVIEAQIIKDLSGELGFGEDDFLSKVKK